MESRVGQPCTAPAGAENGAFDVAGLPLAPGAPAQNTHAELQLSTQIADGKLVEPLSFSLAKEPAPAAPEPEEAPATIKEAQIAVNGAAVTRQTRNTIKGGKPEQWTPQAVALAERILNDPKVLAIARRAAFSYTRGTPEDLVQELAMRLARGKFDIGSGNSIYGLVKTTLRWIITDAIRQDYEVVEDESKPGGTALVRKEAPVDVADHDSEFGANEDSINAMLRTVDIEQALNHLSASHREIVVCVYFRGMTLREVAEELNIPLGTAKSRVYYALRALRIILEGSFGDYS